MVLLMWLILRMNFDEKYNNRLRYQKFVNLFIVNNKNILNDNEKEYVKINVKELPFLFMHLDSDICVSPSQTLFLIMS